MSINLGVTHFRCIAAVEQYENFTEAADVLHIGQPSLSRTVAEAERRLNVQLFTRTTRRVVVTAEGREIARYSRKILSAFDDGRADIQRFLTGDRGSVTIACLPSIAATLLPPYVMSYRQSHPDVHLSIRDGLLAASLSAVRDGNADLAIVATYGPLAGLTQIPIALDSFFCVVPQSHQFAAARHLEWTQLADEPFITFGAESSIEGPVRRALEDAGIEIGPTVQAQNVGAVAGLVAAGMGITVIPALVLPMISFAGLAHIPLTPTLQRRISIVQLDERRQTACTREFIDSILNSPPQLMQAPLV